ncbi:hypothetical protein D1818_01165 [Aquimarina sp. BL5]|uniref:hypothetical protein n=1 Tax=Aquimarina sp. BL5 TaxID=1714860 RepID=UPI000E509BAF|nr:hypothetical protein [Aquimarina sp. BL5]AXT49495.1 hypothetical protein D1818_01165 [Aquimarina sp. BL5]RKN02505.1 hypothetical protein D7036_16410 [Aquimarina sp. BL5]
MELVDKKQKWKGQFTYLDGYNTLDQYREVDFMMEIDVNNSSFVGISRDSESKELFDKPASVKGFFDNDMISFVLKYPYSYYRDDHGTLVVEKEYEHPDIQYIGFYDEDLKEYKGNWEIVVDQEAYGTDNLLEVVNGGFELRRVN